MSTTATSNSTVQSVTASQTHVTYKVEAFTAYIPSVDRETGEEITLPVKVRRVLLQDPRAIGDSGYYKVTQNRRGETMQYSISVLPRIDQNPWQNPDHPGSCVAWYTLGDQYKPAGKDKLSSLGLVEWLTVRLGNQVEAMGIVNELEDGVFAGSSRRTAARKKAATDRKTKIAGKCSCGKPVWSQSHTNQCFLCTPVQETKIHTPCKLESTVSGGG